MKNKIKNFLLYIIVFGSWTVLCMYAVTKI